MEEGGLADCGLRVNSIVAFVYRCRLLAVLFKLTVEHSYGGAQRFCCPLLGGRVTSTLQPHTSPATRGWRGRFYTPELFIFMDPGPAAAAFTLGHDQEREGYMRLALICSSRP